MLERQYQILQAFEKNKRGGGDEGGGSAKRRQKQMKSRLTWLENGEADDELARLEKALRKLRQRHGITHNTLHWLILHKGRLVGTE